MSQSGKLCRIYIIWICLPFRVIIPWNKIQLFRKLAVIKTGIKAHKIACNRNVVRIFTDGFNFLFHKIRSLISYKAFPVKRQSVKTHISERSGRNNLFSIGKCMRPKLCPPFVIQLFQSTVFFLKPFTKSRTAERAVTFSAVFIWYMPCNKSWIVGIALRKLFIYNSDFFSIYRRGVAMIVSCSEFRHCGLLKLQDIFVPSTQVLRRWALQE